METEIWINEIMESTVGMVKIIPNHFLFEKIQNRINLESKFSNLWIFVAAASFAMLISINIKLLNSNSSKTNDLTETAITNLSNTNQLY